MSNNYNNSTTLDNTALEYLLARAALRDQNAFQRLYESTSPKLYGIAYQLLKSKEWAEEALQEAFVKVWYNAGNYRAEKGAVMTWMGSIVRYRALDILRKHKNMQTVDIEDSDHANNPWLATNSDMLEKDKEKEHLLNCLEELQEQQKKTILMAFYEGNTHEELSNRLKVPLGTIKSWVRRGLEKVKRCLER